jgi:hypothetical protein
MLAHISEGLHVKIETIIELKKKPQDLSEQCYSALANLIIASNGIYVLGFPL